MVFCAFLLLALLLLLLAMHFFFYFQLKGIRMKSTSFLPDDRPVSIVICAHNEEANLRKNLPLLLRQSHANSEWILVDDASEDQSRAVIKEWADKDSRVRLIPLNHKTGIGKHEALRVGIENAAHEFILLTDADCQPASVHWIKRMAAPLMEADIILGYAPLTKQRGWLSRVIRYDSCVVAMQYLSLAEAGLPYMGVGRNMASRKSFFLRIQQEMKKPLTASGDDDLFVNAASRTGRFRCVLHPETFMWSAHPDSAGQWWRQKRRQLGAGFHYRPVHLLVLSIYPLSLMLFYGFFGFLFFSSYRMEALLSYLLYALIVIFITSRTFNILQQDDLRFRTPLLEFLYLIQVILFDLSLLLKREKRWK